MTSKKKKQKNKMSSQLPLAIYAGLPKADIPGPWHYKG